MGGVASGKRGGEVIRHFVLFTLADDAGETEAELTASLRALPETVPGIIDLSLTQPINDGSHDYLLTVDVADEEALAAYRSHPNHVPVGQLLRRVSSDVVVADIVI